MPNVGSFCFDRVTKYYAADNGVFYTVRDHLNSSSVITNQSGAVVTNGNQYFYLFACPEPVEEVVIAALPSHRYICVSKRVE